MALRDDFERVRFCYCVIHCLLMNWNQEILSTSVETFLSETLNTALCMVKQRLWQTLSFQEFNNDAELLLCDVAINDDDTCVDTGK